MTQTLRNSLLIGVILYFLIIIYFLRKKRVSLKYSILWILFGFVLLFIDLFPGAIILISQLLGIQTPVNTVFTLILFSLIIIIISMTSIITNLNEKVKSISQSFALLEKKTRDLEEKINATRNDQN
jgi:hypothetical protein